MLLLPGPPALSTFRIAKLLERLQALEPAVQGLEARFLHFADLAAPLSAPERAVLEQLLTYGPSLPATTATSASRILIVPRAGTISPWSSKATDIAQVCGLRNVRRLERGIEYGLSALRPLPHATLTALAPALCDRMTEMALWQAADAARLFEQTRPQPLASVSLAG